jgi:hypothetical protein
MLLALHSCTFDTAADEDNAIDFSAAGSYSHASPKQSNQRFLKVKWQRSHEMYGSPVQGLTGTLVKLKCSGADSSALRPR